MLFPRVRGCLLAIAILAMLAGASGQLSPALSTALLLPSLVMLACDPSSPVRRAVERGLHIAVEAEPVVGAGDAPGGEPHASG
ncbi:MAG TPA: hypothetical protein VG295_07475 [Solirubrobacteraceae bacterium]|jgi:hypothetical protein|nr:hypothetical protein [Solirubrobacteraceae bacterium]